MRKPNILKTNSLIKKILAVSLLLVLSLPAYAATELKDILRVSLLTDPSMLSVKATEDAAKATTKATRAGHYPVISLTGTQVIAQKHKYSSDDMSNGLGVRGSLNLYSWGGISSAVRRDKQKEIYQHYKYYETQEQLGGTIGKLYLTALRAKESLAVSTQTYNRYSNLLKDLNIIVKYDGGRRSEIAEARSRQLQVQTTMLQLERTMVMALSRLSRYTNRPVTVNDLIDPFRNDTAKSLISKYQSGNHKDINPSYLAQEAESKSAEADLDVSKAARLPAFNLQGVATRDTRQLYVDMQWNVLDMAARHNVTKNAQTLIAAQSKAEEILLESEEKSRTSAVDMVQSEQRVAITAAHIDAQKEVVKNYELQFKIARRTLTDVLGSYNELANIEQENVTARNDFRDAALNYLVAQSQMANWAGVTAKEN